MKTSKDTPFTSILSHTSEYEAFIEKLNRLGFECVLIIGPKGEKEVYHVFKNNKSLNDAVPWLTGPVRVYDGQLSITHSEAERGWVLYEDLCKGKIEGVQADLDCWKWWQQRCEAYALDHRNWVLCEPSYLPTFLLHPEVERRRNLDNVNREELEAIWEECKNSVYTPKS